MQLWCFSYLFSVVPGWRLWVIAPTGEALSFSAAKKKVPKENAVPLPRPYKTGHPLCQLPKKADAELANNAQTAAAENSFSDN